MCLSDRDMREFSKYAKQQVEACEVTTKAINGLEMSDEIKKVLIHVQTNIANAWLTVIQHFEKVDDENSTD